jgi:tetratricopeptide (TPR) repeat protein
LQKDPADELLRVERIFNTTTDEPALWSLLAADPERVLTLADQYRQMGAYDDALKLLEHHYTAQPANQRAPGAVLPQDYPLVAYYRGYFKSKMGQDPKADFAIAAKLSTLYVFPHRQAEYQILRTALQQNENDAAAHDLLGYLYFDSNSPNEAIAEWKRALALNKKPACASSQSGHGTPGLCERSHRGFQCLARRRTLCSERP